MLDNNHFREIVLECESLILTREFVHELAKKIEAQKLSRQKSIGWLDEKLFHELKLRVFHANGAEFHVYPGIYEDAYFGSMDYRWNTDIKAFADRMPQRAPNKKLLLRLWLWDLAFKIDGNPIVLN